MTRHTYLYQYYHISMHIDRTSIGKRSAYGILSPSSCPSIPGARFWRVSACGCHRGTVRSAASGGRARSGNYNSPKSVARKRVLRQRRRREVEGVSAPSYQRTGGGGYRVLFQLGFRAAMSLPTAAPISLADALRGKEATTNSQKIFHNGDRIMIVGDPGQHAAPNVKAPAAGYLSAEENGDVIGESARASATAPKHSTKT